MIPELRDLSYESRLLQCGLTTLRPGSNYKKSNQLQLLSNFQFNYNYTSTIFESVTITPFQFQL